MPPIATLHAVVLDCADPDQLAAFYRTVTGWDVSYRSETFVFIGEGATRIGFQRIGGYRRPDWPGGNPRAHLDFTVPDLDTGIADLLAAGATLPADQPGNAAWTVLLDPAGHPLCLTTT
ncbi:VOC family protein [Kitasatospora paracochleata]|uniref:Catechol 2,3-dioxygenase-like lactoylglutathione lyase family enzyme n=1 Tax=Kitasatospora paracochleata TaxID=58354 RepID=A0ABT1IR24_9ACTN|nr:VOC family protein [Kitasatospora paracochleata]MCP2307381.1 catechol 2,3-dioxygenase-like lactoylglutathione lyase family enzyme [Kitasatospora paracochleata]